MKSNEAIAVNEAERIHEELRKRYAAVARQPAGQFSYPTGRESAEQLRYPRVFLDLLPPGVVEHFVGVGNPFSLGEPKLGWSVLDIGCGAGFDSQIAARYVGPKGRVIGVDLSEEMLPWPVWGKRRSVRPIWSFAKGSRRNYPWSRSGRIW